MSSELRLLVGNRADYLCEYCLIAEDDAFFGCETDHIVSVKHGGETDVDNLAYACVFCNRHKGSDIASLSKTTGTLIRFFNPRTDSWSNHFGFKGMLIEAFSEVGEVTARILRFNDNERILEREALNGVGRYPNTSAIALIKR